MQVPHCKNKTEPCPVASEKEIKRLINMCEFVMDLACGGRHGRTEYTCLEKQMNKKGMKPLHVAAHYGNVDVSIVVNLSNPFLVCALFVHSDRMMWIFHWNTTLSRWITRLSGQLFNKSNINRLVGCFRWFLKWTPIRPPIWCWYSSFDDA